MSKYAKARTVTRSDIAREMGWTYDQTTSRLVALKWLVKHFRVGHFRYNATVIEVLQQLYDNHPMDDQDWLSTYLASKEIT